MQIINKYNPLQIQDQADAQKIAIIKKFYDSIAEDDPVKTIVLGFMFVKLNFESIKAAYLFYKENPGIPDEQRNIVALGGGNGMPLHLELYPTLEALEKGLQGIIERVEESITWAIETDRLKDLAGSLTIGCCMESHSRTLLDYVLGEQGKRPLTLKEKMIAITRELDRAKQGGEAKEAELKTEEVFLFYAKHVGSPLQTSDNSAQVKKREFLTLDQIANQLTLMGLYDEDVINSLRKSFQEIFSELYHFKIRFLASPEVFACNVVHTLKIINELKLTPSKLAQFSVYLTPEEVDLALLVFASVDALDLVQVLIKPHTKVFGNQRNSNTGKTALIVLINRIELIKNDANKSPDKKNSEIDLICNIINQLLARGIDLYVRDEDRLSALAYAFKVDAVIPGLALGQRLLAAVKQPKDILGHALVEMASHLPSFLVPLQNLLRIDSEISFKLIEFVSAFFYIIQNDPELIHEYFHKMRSPIAKVDGIVNAVQQGKMALARLLYNDFKDAAEMEWKEEVDVQIKDNIYRRFVNSLLKLSGSEECSLSVKIKLVRDTIHIVGLIVKKTDHDNDSLDMLHQKLSTLVNNSSKEEKSLAKQVVICKEALDISLRVKKKTAAHQQLLNTLRGNLCNTMLNLAQTLNSPKEKITLIISAIEMLIRVDNKTPQEDLMLDQLRRNVVDLTYSLTLEEKDPKKRVVLARDILPILMEVPIRSPEDLQILNFHYFYYAQELARYALITKDHKKLEEASTLLWRQRHNFLLKTEELFIELFQYFQHRNILSGKLFEVAQRIASNILVVGVSKEAKQTISRIFQIDLPTQKKHAFKNDIGALVFLIKHFSKPRLHRFLKATAWDKALLFLHAKVILLTENLDEFLKRSPHLKDSIEKIRSASLAYFYLLGKFRHELKNIVQWYRSVLQDAAGKHIQCPERYLLGKINRSDCREALEEGMQKGLSMTLNQIEALKPSLVNQNAKRFNNHRGLEQKQAERPRI